MDKNDLSHCFWYLEVPYYSCIHSLSMKCTHISEVTVGFRDVSVAFSESSESVSLEVVLVAGVLQRPVTLLFTTRDGTATGM